MKKRDINHWAAEFGMNVIIRFKYLFFLAVIALCVIGVIGAGRVVMDSSNESFFSKNDPTILQNEKFKEIFGNEEFIFILIEADDIFTYDVLNYIKELNQDLSENLPFMDDAMSLVDVEYFEVEDDMLLIENLIEDEIPRSQEELNLIKEKVFSKDAYVDKIITRDGKKAGIIISFEKIPETVYLEVNKNFTSLDQEKWPADKIIMQKNIFDEEDAKSNNKLVPITDPRKLIAPALDTIVARHQNDDIEVKITGLSYVDYHGDKTIMTEGSTVGLIALIAAIFLLAILFRSLRGVIAPILVCIITVICIFGIMGYFKFPAGMSSVIIMPLIMVISVSYSIHIINHFLHSFRINGHRREAVKYSYEHSTWPCFATSLTTSMGFASMIIVPIRPLQHIGIICSSGVFITYILAIILIPSFYSIGRDKKMPEHVKKKNSDMSNHILVKWADFVLKHALKTSIITAIIMAILIFFSFRLQVDSGLTDMIGDKVEFVRDAQYIGDNLGGTFSYEILIELPEPNMVKDPAILKTIEEISDIVSKWEGTSETFSINDMIKDLNMTMHLNDKTYNRIPDNKNLIAQYLLLYEMSGGEELDSWVDYDFKTVHISVQLASYSIELADKFEDLMQYAKEKFPEGTTVTVTGDIPILLKTMKAISYGQIQSIGIVLLVITLFMMIILQSFKLGLISMIPNVLPIAVVTGLMGLLNFKLDILTILIIPMIIGIAVDDTVHYFIHFKQEFMKVKNYKQANRETFLKVGKAIVSTSIILILGFSVFVFQKINNLFNLAILASSGILTALLADLFITPALFLFFKPYGKDDTMK